MDEKRIIEERRVIEAMWEKFRQAYIPPETPAPEIKRYRMAFFLGANTIIRINMFVANPAVPREECIEVMKDLDRELREFLDDVEKEEDEAEEQK